MPIRQALKFFEIMDNNNNLLDVLTGGEPVKVEHEIIMTWQSAFIIIVIIAVGALTQRIFNA